MTGTDMVDELQQALGNRTDITQARLIRWLNWAMLDLCGFHRKRLFTPKRFHQLEGQTLFQLSVQSGVCSGNGSSNTILLGSSGFSNVDDFYIDYVVVCNDEEKVIVDYNGATLTATVHSAWTTTPSNGDAFTLHSRKATITGATGLLQDNFWTILRLEEIDTGAELEQKEWKEVTGGTHTTLADPSEFARFADSLLFPSAPEATKSYRCFYYRQPTLLTAGNLAAEADLSEPWHEPIVLGAIWRGHERLMEPERATRARELYVDEAANRLDDYMIEDAFIQRGMRVRR